MWVEVREKEKNKEKCVNGATFLTVLRYQGIKLDHWDPFETDMYIPGVIESHPVGAVRSRIE
jgi:hypothetical protein